MAVTLVCLFLYTLLEPSQHLVELLNQVIEHLPGWSRQDL